MASGEREKEPRQVRLACACRSALIAAGGQTWKNGASTNRSTTEIGDGHARPGVDGVRRGGSWRRSFGPCRSNPAETAVGRHFRRGRGKGLRGRRPHHV